MDDELAGAPATWLAARLRSGDVSAREVLDAHLDRIGSVNGTVNAIVTLEPERAREDAAAADERLARGGPPGPLHGLPIAIKDLVQTRGIRTTFGSPIYADNVPDTDDLLVERIRRAGAVVIGKTNTPEWGAGSHTFNPVFGVTRNPADPTRSAGGSSGGAAAALALGMVPIADGSDLGGSLRNPASFCGIVGFRPSPGRVPSWPTDDPTDDLSVEGPMGRSVEDAALLLSAIAGPDPRIPISLPDDGAVFGPPLDVDVVGTRVAFAPSGDGVMPFEPDIVHTVTSAGRILERLGCTLVDAFPDLAGARDAFLTLRARAYARDLGPLLERERGRMKATVVWNVEAGLALTPDDVDRAVATKTAIHDRVDAFFSRIDVLAMPVTQVPPFPAELEYPTEVAGVPMATYLDWMASCWTITVTGLPAISVPCGFTPDGLPVGLQLVGRRGGDLPLLRLAHAFEGAADLEDRRPT
ncbi:MAG TPA: amidase [Actinomycetota bacterium]